MNREEFATKVQDLVNQAYLHDVDNKYYKGLMDEVEKLREPITLAELLGWEVWVEYEDEDGFTHRLIGSNDLQTYYDSSETWDYFDLEWNRYVIDRLRNVKKVEDKKFYAKIKGWELIENSKFIYWNVDNEERDVFISTDGPVSGYHASLTKKEWSELGITDENADFEEVD